MSDPSYIETFAELGVLLQFYVSFQTLLQSNLSLLQPDKWHFIVKNQVYKINDPQLDTFAAYNLMEKQYDQCAVCSSYLNLKDPPSIVAKSKTYSFLGMKHIDTSYKWVCSKCTDRNQHIQNKIAELVREEENKLQMGGE